MRKMLQTFTLVFNLLALAACVVFTLTTSILEEGVLGKSSTHAFLFFISAWFVSWLLEAYYLYKN